MATATLVSVKAAVSRSAVSAVLPGRFTVKEAIDAVVGTAREDAAEELVRRQIRVEIDAHRYDVLQILDNGDVRVVEPTRTLSDLAPVEAGGAGDEGDLVQLAFEPIAYASVG